jgi:hypothetical protein
MLVLLPGPGCRGGCWLAGSEDRVWVREVRGWRMGCGVWEGLRLAGGRVGRWLGGWRW